MANDILAIVQGSTNYSYFLAQPVQVTKLQEAGSLQKIGSAQRRSDQIDAPWSIQTFMGLAIPKAWRQDIDDNSTFEERNIDTRWPGLTCLGPKARAPTDVSSTHLINGYAEGLGSLFYWATTSEAGAEPIAYWVGATTTWTSATARADWGVDIVPTGMVAHSVSGVARMYYVTRVERDTGALNYQQVAYSTDKTTWTAINVGNAPGNCPSGDTSKYAYFLADVAGTMYSLAQASTFGAITLRQSTDDGTTWTSSTGGTLTSTAAPRGIKAWRDSAGNQALFVFLQEGIYRYTGSTFVLEVDYGSDQNSNNGLYPTIWHPNDAADALVVPQGRRLWMYSWDASGAGRLVPTDISPPVYQMPTYRFGKVLALTPCREFLWAAIGGEDANHKAGIYAMNRAGKWHGPLYDIGTANRQVRAMQISSLDDSTLRVHFSLDNGTASDTDPLFFQDMDVDPRYVSGYQHAAAGDLILPKNARYLDELLGRWQYMEFLGTNFSATNTIIPYAVADVAPIGADGTWGSAMTTVTANAGTSYFAATPTGTALSARAVQIRLALAGTSDASPYIETINIHVEKNLPVKLIRTYIIDPHGQGTVRPMQLVLSELATLLTNTTDLSVTDALTTTATTMKPYKLGDPISYEYKGSRDGTVASIADVKYVILRLVEV